MSKGLKVKNLVAQVNMSGNSCDKSTKPGFYSVKSKYQGFTRLHLKAKIFWFMLRPTASLRFFSQPMTVPPFVFLSFRPFAPYPPRLTSSPHKDYLTTPNPSRAMTFRHFVLLSFRPFVFPPCRMITLFLIFVNSKQKSKKR